VGKLGRCIVLAVYVLNLSNLKVLTKPGKEAVSRLSEVSIRLNLEARQRKICFACALFYPKSSVSIQKCPLYRGNLNSEMPGDGKDAILHWRNVFGCHTRADTHTQRSVSDLLYELQAFGPATETV